MKYFRLLIACWAVTTVGVAAAQPVHASASPKYVSKARQPAGKPVRPSSYAPRPVPKNRAYGAPISTPILRHVKPQKPSQTQPRTTTRAP